ncbi:hypothetical protein BgAZ_204770 [Babesia gibsoni]|uniref:Uncharacterized protein n=1 Tax=Babesia gibsoni TaxID=33632 RepID=A0AAD8LQQ8_BABGI|nr:hypothetical protein BgAZ_204770 [Babesia gibsoni]
MIESYKDPKNRLDTELLDDVDEKLFPVAHSSGIILPDRDDMPPDVSNEHYNIALASLYHDHDALYTLLKRLRYEKLRKLSSHDGWNPFDLQHVNVCTPIPIGDIEQYGYDEQTSSCRCPNTLIPCTRQQAASDRSFWSFKLRRLARQHKFTRRYDRLKLAARHLNILNTKGVLLQTVTLDAAAYRKRQMCNAVDAVLCSVRDNSRASTQWSPWGGCSEKCNRGMQERLKITYNNGGMQLVVDKKHCELAKCSDYKQLSGPQCTLSVVPPSEQRNVVVRTCSCPEDGSILCSSEEARLSMPIWIPQFREFCKASLNINPSNKVLYKDLPDLKNLYLGRFIYIRFKDGYYFDCTERWGILDKNYTTNYCKIGSPILCKEKIEKNTHAASFVEVNSYEHKKKDMIFTLPLFMLLIVVSIVYTLLYSFISRRKRSVLKQS